MLYVLVHVGVCVYMCVHVPSCGGQKLASGVISPETSTILLQLFVLR